MWRACNGSLRTSSAAANAKMGTQYIHIDAFDIPTAATARCQSSAESPDERAPDKTSTIQGPAVEGIRGRVPLWCESAAACANNMTAPNVCVQSATDIASTFVSTR